MPVSPQQAKNTIDQIFAQYDPAAPHVSLLPAALTTGKVYEAWVLCEVLRRLRVQEGYTATLVRSNKITLKSSHGPINPDYPCFVLTKAGQPALEVWTDVEFLALSYGLKLPGSPTTKGDFHELDIVVVPAGTTGQPRFDVVRIGVECKDTGYKKELLRSILGVRRELSLLQNQSPTGFTVWPRATVPAQPASCLSVYSTDPGVVNFADPGVVFGIDFIHFPAP